MVGKMKVTKRQLRKIISEESKLLKEEEYDFYRDYRAGLISREEYEQAVRNFQRRSGYSTRPRRTRKTTYVGSGANAAKIKAVEDAIAVKPNNFLNSVLKQLKAGRGLSAKQNAIVRKILSKRPYNADATLFEGKGRMKIKKSQLDKIIVEAAKVMAEGRSNYEAGYDDGMAGVDVRPSAMATRGEQEKKHANAEYRRGYVDGTIGRHSGKRRMKTEASSFDRATGEGSLPDYEEGYKDGMSGADIPPEFAANPSYRRGYDDAESGNYNPPEPRRFSRYRRTRRM
jgi:hypothetical protein